MLLTGSRALPPPAAPAQKLCQWQRAAPGRVPSAPACSPSTRRDGGSGAPGSAGLLGLGGSSLKSSPPVLCSLSSGERYPQGVRPVGSHPNLLPGQRAEHGACCQHSQQWGDISVCQYFLLFYRLHLDSEVIHGVHDLLRCYITGDTVGGCYNWQLIS